jgi:hypothetical protein
MVLTVNSGVLLILVKTWTYVRREVVNGAVPNSGQVVTQVAISGGHLGSASARRNVELWSVMFGGVAASVAFTNDTCASVVNEVRRPVEWTKAAYAIGVLDGVDGA